MTTRGKFLFVLAILSPTLVWAEDAALSVEQFNKLKGNWPNYAAVGTPLTVEGRFSSFSRNSFRLRNCELLFQAQTGVFFAKPTDPDKIVQLTGRLSQRGKKLIFLISRLKELPSDFDTFRRRELQLDRDDAEPWYDLGKWARNRSQFYEDKQLASEAETAIVKGLTIELRKLKRSDATGLHNLADKALQLNSAPRFQMQLRHQALLADWNNIQNLPAKAEQKKLYDPLLKQLEEFLPGASVPINQWDKKLANRYETTPKTTYENADDKQRVRLHRLFYIAVAEQKFQSELDPSGHNGNAIAIKIEEVIPERKSLAETYRLKEIEYKFERVANSTKAELLALVRELEDRKDKKRADQAQQVWLNALAERMKPDGVDGLMQVAQEYLNIRNDKQQAVELLIAAYKLEPESKPVTQFLNQLGYKLHKGEWISNEKMQNLPVDKIAQAMRQGRVSVGMSPVQVRKMLGQPGQRSRLATRNEISEVWVYGQPGGNQLAIQFQRRKLDSEAKATVVRISDLAR